jgi:GTP-binding protein
LRFIDEAKIKVESGSGGRGCVSFRKEKYVPRGGPDGGDGGRGGDVIFVSDSNLSSLLDFRYKHSFTAGRGEHGLGKLCSGLAGDDLVLTVPVGTAIKDAETGEVVHDFTGDGERFVCLKGGRGGKGNAFFKTSTNQAPRHAQPGESGLAKTLLLELKLLADVGLVGFPNAGKSTFISVVSAARPRIADYPFTTLVPHLGVVRFGEHSSFVLADIPGLIEGAAEGKGLGIKFLKHVERTRILIHMIDLSPATGRDPLDDYEVINRELRAFDPALAKRPQVVALNKTDITEAREDLPRLLKFFGDKGIKCFSISAATGDGAADVINYVGMEVERLKAAGKESGRKEKEDNGSGEEGCS